jgi:hypothetical protein
VTATTTATASSKAITPLVEDLHLELVYQLQNAQIRQGCSKGMQGHAKAM